MVHYKSETFDGEKIFFKKPYPRSAVEARVNIDGVNYSSVANTKKEAFSNIKSVINKAKTNRFEDIASNASSSTFNEFTDKLLTKEWEVNGTNQSGIPIMWVRRADDSRQIMQTMDVDMNLLGHWSVKHEIVSGDNRGVSQYPVDNELEGIKLANKLMRRDS